jgi:hypothetical protein
MIKSIANILSGTDKKKYYKVTFWLVCSQPMNFDHELLCGIEIQHSK